MNSLLSWFQGTMVFNGDGRHCMPHRSQHYQTGQGDRRADWVSWLSSLQLNPEWICMARCVNNIIVNCNNKYCNPNLSKQVQQHFPCMIYHSFRAVTNFWSRWGYTKIGIWVAVVKSTCWLYIKVAGDILKIWGQKSWPALNNSPAQL